MTYGLCGVWAGITAGFASRRKKRRALIALLALVPFLFFGVLSALAGSAVTGTGGLYDARLQFISCSL